MIRHTYEDAAQWAVRGGTWALGHASRHIEMIGQDRRGEDRGRWVHVSAETPDDPEDQANIVDVCAEVRIQSHAGTTDLLDAAENVLMVAPVHWTNSDANGMNVEPGQWRCSCVESLYVLAQRSAVGV
jgi:hypothetical protein